MVFRVRSRTGGELKRLVEFVEPLALSPFRLLSHLDPTAGAAWTMQVPPRCEVSPYRYSTATLLADLHSEQVCGEQLGRCEAHQSIPGILRPLFAALHRLESSRAPKACSAASSPYIVPFGALLLTQRPLNWVDSASTFYNYFGPGGPKKEHVLGGEFGLRLVGSVFWRIVDDDQVGYPDVTWLDAIIAAIDERM